MDPIFTIKDWIEEKTPIYNAMFADLAREDSDAKTYDPYPTSNAKKLWEDSNVDDDHFDTCNKSGEEHTTLNYYRKETARVGAATSELRLALHGIMEDMKNKLEAAGSIPSRDESITIDSFRTIKLAVYELKRDWNKKLFALAEWRAAVDIAQKRLWNALERTPCWKEGQRANWDDNGNRIAK